MSHPGPRFFHRCIHRCAMGLYTRRRRRRRRLEAVLLLLQRKRERRRTGRLKETTTTSKKGGKKEKKAHACLPCPAGLLSLLLSDHASFVHCNARTNDRTPCLYTTTTNDKRICCSKSTSGQEFHIAPPTQIPNYVNHFEFGTFFIHFYADARWARALLNKSHIVVVIGALDCWLVASLVEFCHQQRGRSSSLLTRRETWRPSIKHFETAAAAMTINQVLLLLPFFLADVSSTTAKKRKEKITGRGDLRSGFCCRQLKVVENSFHCFQALHSSSTCHNSLASLIVTVVFHRRRRRRRGR